jgi:hypothetical protein
MRKRLIHTILLTGFLCAPAFAQGVEIFGGAQYEHQQPSYNAVGWNASLPGNFQHVLGITGDFKISLDRNARLVQSQVSDYPTIRHLKSLPKLNNLWRPVRGIL